MRRWTTLVLALVACSESGGNAGAGGGGGSLTAGGGGLGDLPSLCASEGALTWPEPALVEVPPHPAWKAELSLDPVDAFFEREQTNLSGGLIWAKFVILSSDPERVYFQDATAHPFHYEFAAERLPPFAGMTREQFAEVSLRNEGRQAVLGAIVMPRDRATREYGVQIVSNDAVHPELVVRVLQTVAAHVQTPGGSTAFYLPSGPQETCADEQSERLSALGVNVASVDRWLTDDACYSPGWAVGKLVALGASEVDAAYLDGRLKPEDVLLLTEPAPAELPFVSGIVTLAPSTPNAHAAILARSYDIPFAYARSAAAREAALALAGQAVLVSTYRSRGMRPYDSGDGGCLRFVPLDGLSEAELAEARAGKVLPPLVVQPKRASGAFTTSLDGLSPADIDRVGGKAAHFTLIREAAPELAPSPAFALTFDLWDAFLDAPQPSGESLRAESARRLAPYSWPPDMLALDAVLGVLRDRMRGAPLPEAARASVLEALAGFEPERRIRFRSSTNVEDSETFTGAGLYDSATGCLADDLDADDAGPSRCNPAELEEHGVFRAIARVYASFYLRNAYLERLRRGVDEASVGMGVLVHHSVPDPEELANGVATLQFQDRVQSARLITQLGAVSVTNPEGGALPEDVTIDNYDIEDYMKTSVATQMSSSLVPLGAHVLDYEADYVTLMHAFNRVGARYAAVTGRPLPLQLDFEYKKVAPGTLSLRQVRPLPPVDWSPSVTPYIVGSSRTLCLTGGEGSDALAAHRLKARIALTGRNTRLDPAALATSLYTAIRVDSAEGGVVRSLEGDPASLPGASHGIDPLGDHDSALVDQWTAAGATWALRTHAPVRVARNDTGVITLDDLRFSLTAIWAAPVPALESTEEGDFVAGTRTEDSVELWPYCPEEVARHPDFPAAFPRVEKSYASPSGSGVVTTFYYPPAPTGPTSGYTAPLVAWDQTTIIGLTSDPIVLTSYYSQTHVPAHHNFGGEYVFEPRLDPGVSASQLAELEAADVVAVVVVDRDSGSGVDELWAIGLDGTLRRL